MTTCFSQRPILLQPCLHTRSVTSISCKPREARVIGLYTLPASSMHRTQTLWNTSVAILIPYVHMQTHLNTLRSRVPRKACSVALYAAWLLCAPYTVLVQYQCRYTHTICPHANTLEHIQITRAQESMISSLIRRVGQNHIYTVYIQYFWQGNHQICGHIRRIYTVLANPAYTLPDSYVHSAPILVQHACSFTDDLALLMIL